eukprot:6181755-Pleurochrysis_carterae.AAC.1
MAEARARACTLRAFTLEVSQRELAANAGMRVASHCSQCVACALEPYKGKVVLLYTRHAHICPTLEVPAVASMNTVGIACRHILHPTTMTCHPPPPQLCNEPALRGALSPGTDHAGRRATPQLTGCTAIRWPHRPAPLTQTGSPHHELLPSCLFPKIAAVRAVLGTVKSYTAGICRRTEILTKHPAVSLSWMRNQYSLSRLFARSLSY